MRARALAVGIFALLAPLALPGAAQDAERRPASLADLVPATSVAYISVPDVPAAAQAFAKTDFGQAWGELRPFVDDLWQGLGSTWIDVQSQFEHETGLKLDHVLAALGGGVEFALLDLNQYGDPGDAVFLVRMAGREEAVRAILAKIAAPNPHTGRQDLHATETGGVALIATRKELLEPIGAALAGNSALGYPALSSSPDFAAVRAKAVPAGHVPLVHAYLNVTPLLDKAVKDDPGAAKVLYQTGLRDARAAGLGITFHGGKVAVAATLHAPSTERRGVLPILAHGPADVAGLAKLAPADAVGFSALRLDLAAAYDRLLALVDSIEPAAGENLRGEVAELESKMQISLRQDLLGALGADWAWISVLPEGGGFPASIATVSSPAPDKLAATLAKLTSAFGMETREVARSGKTIRYVRGRLGRLGEDPMRRMERDPFAAAPMILGFIGNAYAIDGGRLWLADAPQTLEEFFARSRAGGDLSTAPAFQAAAKGASPAAGAFAYVDPRPTFPFFWNSGVRLLRLVEGFARAAGIPVDLALLPRGAALARLLAPGSSELLIDDQGLALRSEAAFGGIDTTAGTVAVIAAIAIPNLIQARKGANEAAAIGALRTLTTAQALFREGDKDRDTVLDYATSLQELGKSRLIDGVLASGVKQGYRFRILIAPGTDNKFCWYAEAMPAAPGKSGDRSFFVDETGVIRFAFAPEQAGPDSLAIGR